MKKFLLVGLGIGAAAYTIRASFYLGALYGSIRLGNDILRSLGGNHENG